MRAYTESASQALAAAKIVTVRSCVRGSVTVDYSLYEQAARLLEAAGARMEEPEFAAAVTLRFVLPQGEEQPLLPKFRELSRGAAELEISGLFIPRFDPCDRHKVKISQKILKKIKGFCPQNLVYIL